MYNSNTKKLVGVSMLGALAFIVMFFAFPIIPGVSFLKVDFSDIPVLVGMFLYGPVGGTMVAFIRSLLHYVQTGGDAGFPIGDVASFLASVSLTLPIYLYLRNKTINIKNMAAAGLAGTVSLTILLSVMNWFVLAPLYMMVLNFDVGPIQTYVLYAVVPFNILKGLIVSAVFVPVLTKLKPWLQRNQLTDFSYMGTK